MTTGKKKAPGGDALLASNRAASHEFHLLDRFEAGLVLTGAEVKSCRAGKVNLKEAYAKVKDGEVFLHGAHLSPYLQAGRDAPDPVRVRKLLLHAREIRRLARETEQGGMTLVPLKLYLKDGRIKLEIALGKGKKAGDKREALKEKESAREMARARALRG
ncbi:MAG TPA: SsrA-binding protein SmpB [Candidatus Polarisedimenticolaceae bacterium]|nr:SsrA-binding protein SmpB [Candidatus Polarisedimenticolaceae bacterium]